MKQLFTIIFLLFAVVTSYAQSITGRVVDENSKPIVGAAAMMLTLPDSTIVASTITDSSGVFSFKNRGDIVAVSCFGYKLKYAAPTDTLIMLDANVVEIESIEVNAKSSLTKDGNKFIINAVYASPFAVGQTAIGFFKFAPIIRVSENGQIGILGRSGATILINGRKLANSMSMLATISAQDVEKIEILPTPGSSYRADEQKGVINVILKKDANQGVVGVVRLSDNQSYFNGQSVTSSLSYNSKKVILTAGLSLNHDPYHNQNISTGNYYATDQKIEADQYMNSRRLSTGVYVNMDYLIDSKSTIGFNINSYMYDDQRHYNSTTRYSKLSGSSIDSTDIADVNSSTPMLNYSVTANLHYDFKTDDKGSVLKADATYYHGLAKTVSANIYDRQIGAGNFNRVEDFMQVAKPLVDYYALKVDYKHSFSKDNNNTLRVGAEVYGSTNDNDYFFGNNVDGTYISDSRRTNRFLYDEIVSSVYAQYSRDWSDKWSTVFGMRMESSHAKGNQLSTSQINYRHNTDFFPSVSVTYTASDDHILSLDLNTRIARPDFSMLNPFITYISPTYYVENNPNLKPCKSYGAMLSYTFLKDFTFSADYTYSHNNWTEFDMLVGNNTIRRFIANYSQSHRLSLSIDFSKSFFDDYLQLNGNFSADYSYDKGQVENFAVNNNSWGFWVSASANVAIAKKSKWNMQLRYQYMSAQQWATVSLSASNNLAISVSKQFKDRSALNFGVSKIFTPYWEKQHVSQTSYDYYAANRGFVSYWASYTMRFGNSKTKSASSRGGATRVVN